MKIAILSDTHGELPYVAPCDVVMIAGDISPLNIQFQDIAVGSWLRSKFCPWAKNIQCEHIFLVPGNHDFVFKWLFTKDDLLKYYIEEPSEYKIQVLNNNECIFGVGDASYKIWGSPDCPIFGDWAFMKDSESLKESFKSMPRFCDFILTHTPPRIGKFDTVQEGPYAGKKCGSKELAKEIKDKQPRYSFFGHIHSGDHNLSTYKGYGRTEFANVSYVNEDYQPCNKILYIDVQ